jgi:hypothetical protein
MKFGPCGENTANINFCEHIVTRFEARPGYNRCPQQI